MIECFGEEEDQVSAGEKSIFIRHTWATASLVTAAGLP